MLYYPLKKISGDKTQFYDSLYFICLWFLIFLNGLCVLYCYVLELCLLIKGGKLLCINVAMELF